MTRPDRHVYGPRPVGTLVPGLTRAAFRRHSASHAQIMLDWVAIVGPALAGVTEPRRIGQGTLTIACSGPIAMELQHMAMELMARINTHLGGTQVRALRFVQTMHAGQNGGEARRRGPVPAPPPPRAVAAARKAVADLPDGPLRDALERLGGAVLTPRIARTKR